MTIVSWEFESPPLHVIDVSNDAAIAQLVEHNLAKVGVAGPSPVCRSFSPPLIIRKIHFNEFIHQIF